MKVELIKEVNFLGEISFFIEVNGKYVVGSMTSKEEKAAEMYEFIINNKDLKRKEIIKKTDI